MEARRRLLMLPNKRGKRWIFSKIDDRWVDGYISGTTIATASATAQEKTSPFFKVEPGETYAVCDNYEGWSSDPWVAIGWYSDETLASAISRPATTSSYAEYIAPENAKYARISTRTYGVVEEVAVFCLSDYTPPYLATESSLSWADGYYTSATSTSTAHANGEKYSPDYIEIEPGKDYVLGATFETAPPSYKWFCICGYNSNKANGNRLAANSIDSYRIKARSTDAYARLSLRTYGLNPRIWFICPTKLFE